MTQDMKQLTEKNAMTKEQIEYMANRFLGWKLPDFHPDCGITFDKYAAQKIDSRNAIYEPTGTNLFNYNEALEMVKYMLEGLPND